jgi:hypothetical protein
LKLIVPISIGKNEIKTKCKFEFVSGIKIGTKSKIKLSFGTKIELGPNFGTITKFFEFFFFAGQKRNLELVVN